MFVLRLTSDSSLRGMETDDGFIIGQLSTDSIFLLLLTTAAGMLGGLFYLSVRNWFPRNVRPWALAIFGAGVGGATVISDDGIDFNLLDPLALAVVMFIALPALYGLMLVWLTEKLLARVEESQSRLSWLAFVPLIGLGITGPIGLGILVILTIGWVAEHRGPPFLQTFRTAPFIVIGRIAFAGATAFSLFTLGQDVVAVL
jgi:hypothetical protein